MCPGPRQLRKQMEGHCRKRLKRGLPDPLLVHPGQERGSSLSPKGQRAKETDPGKERGQGEGRGSVREDGGSRRLFIEDLPRQPLSEF